MGGWNVFKLSGLKRPETGKMEFFVLKLQKGIPPECLMVMAYWGVSERRDPGSLRSRKIILNLAENEISGILSMDEISHIFNKEGFMNNKFFLGITIIIFLFCFSGMPSMVWGAESPSPAQSQNPDVPGLSKYDQRKDFAGAWVVGLAGGMDVPTQGITSEINSSLNYDVNLNALYGVAHFETIPLNTLVGLTLDISGHPVNLASNDFNLGQATSFSILPTLEFRSDKINNFSIYGSLGVGANINFYSNSSAFDAICSADSISCNFSPGDSFAFRVALGIDYFTTPNLAVNSEVGYLFNDPTSTAVLAGRGAFASGTGPTNLSTFFWLIGFHYRSWIGKA